MESEMIEREDLAKLGRYGLPEVALGDRVEFLGFGKPDHYFDHATQSYQPIPNQLEPGTLGTVTGLSAGQLAVDWDSGHRILLVVSPFLVAEADFLPDRYRVVEKAPVRRRRTSALAERELLASSR